MKKTIDPIEPKEYSEDLLRCKVNSFVTAPRMLNQSMRQIIAGSVEESFDKILGYCLSKGWNDAIIRERFITSSPIVTNAKCIIDSFGDKLKEEIKNASNSSGFVHSYDSWHNSMCSSKEYGMRYGIWQKFINMTLKYLYCFKDVRTVPDCIPWNDLHCPIDSVIAKQLLGLMQHDCIPDTRRLVESICFNGEYGVSWNSIAEEEYQHVQTIIANLCRRDSIPSKLFFDYIYWERQKNK